MITGLISSGRTVLYLLMAITTHKRTLIIQLIARKVDNVTLSFNRNKIKTFTVSKKRNT